MSYDLYILHVDVKATVEEGFALADIEYPELDDGDVEQLLERLPEFGYELESEEEDDILEYVKDVEGCPIQLRVFKTEVALSVPYWKGSDEAILEACQDAAELSDADSLVYYDPQSDEWID